MGEQDLTNRNRTRPHFQCRPLLFHHESRVMMNFGRTPLMGNDVHPRDKSLPMISKVQEEALDEIEKIARELQLEIKTQSGDMHFINNFTVLHRREGFVNGPEAQQKRHLVRMRLRNSDLGWPVPEELQEDWDDAFSGESATERWNLEPMFGDEFPLRKFTN